MEHRVEPQVLDEGGTAAPGSEPDDQVLEVGRPSLGGTGLDSDDFAASAGIPLNGAGDSLGGFAGSAGSSYLDPAGFAAPPAAGSYDDPAAFAAPSASYQAPAAPPLSDGLLSDGQAVSGPGSSLAGGSYGFAGPAAGSAAAGAVAGGAAGAAGGAADGMRIPPPFSAADSASSGPMSRITSPFSALTRQRGKPRPPKGRQAPMPPRFQQPSAGPQPDSLTGSASQRKAQLILSRVEPWSVMKFSFMISLVGWVVLFVAVAGVYFVLSKLGVFTQIEKTITLVTSTKTSAGTNAADWFSASRVLGYTMLAGAVNVVLITALTTVGAVAYNLITHLAGGIEVTLKETD